MATISENTYLILLTQMKAVQKEFPHCTFQLETDQQAFFDWTVFMEAHNVYYQMRLYINPSLPEVCPSMYVWSPITLPRFSGGTVNEIGAKGGHHGFHILGNGPDDRVQICHSSPGDWDASVAYVLPILKSFIWCSAYEAHLRDGSSISAYFRNQ